MADIDSVPDSNLVARLTAGAPEAADTFFERFKDSIWHSCEELTPNKAAAEKAMKEVWLTLEADGFARLSSYDGRSSLGTFITILVRDLIAAHALRLVTDDVDRFWRDFLAVFDRDIRRIVARFIDETNREDAYQSVSLSLAKDGCRRLLAFSGKVSPFHFVYTVVRNLLRDFVRSLKGRRRLPAAIEKLSPLDQAVFKLIAWENWPSDADGLYRVLGGAQSGFQLKNVEDALERIHRACPSGLVESGVEEYDDSLEGPTDGAAGPFRIGLTPEAILERSQHEALLARATACLGEAIERELLSKEERDVLYPLLEDRKAGEIAVMLKMPVKVVYRTRENILEKLGKILGQKHDVATWLDYVTDEPCRSPNPIRNRFSAAGGETSIRPVATDQEKSSP